MFTHVLTSKNENCTIAGFRITVGFVCFFTVGFVSKSYPIYQKDIRLL